MDVMEKAAGEDAEMGALRAMTAVNPGSVATRLELGKMYRLRGRVAEAREQFEKVLELEPGNAEGHVHLAYTLLVMGELPRGFEHYEWRWKSTQAPIRNREGSPSRSRGVSQQT